jgi:hypothetical protein
VTSVTTRTRKPGVDTSYLNSRTVISAGDSANRSAVIQRGFRFGLYQTTTWSRWPLDRTHVECGRPSRFAA